MTLQECIARYNEAQAQPINERTSVLTPLGHAVVAAARLREALAPLTAEERAHILRPLVAELAPIVA